MFSQPISNTGQQQQRSSTLQQPTTHCNTLQHTTNAPQHITTHCNILAGFSELLPANGEWNHFPMQHTYYVCVLPCSTLQHTATPVIHCNTLQHTATHCNTLEPLSQRNLCIMHKFISPLRFNFKCNAGMNMKCSVNLLNTINVLQYKHHFEWNIRITHASFSPVRPPSLSSSHFSSLALSCAFSLFVSCSCSSSAAPLLSLSLGRQLFVFFLHLHVTIPIISQIQCMGWLRWVGFLRF